MRLICFIGGFQAFARLGGSCSVTTVGGYQGALTVGRVLLRGCNCVLCGFYVIAMVFCVVPRV